MTRRWHEWGLIGGHAPRTEGSASTALGATFWRSSGPSHAARLVGEAVGEAVDTLLLWQARGRARRDLAGLNNQMLHDLGITRADVEREYRKPFWRD
jgi:uncharacterized protein YjiS (DUF1127 family)